MFPYLKFRSQRQLRRLRRDLLLWRRWTANYFDRHVWGKWRQLGIVRRFVAAWLLLSLVAFLGLINQSQMLNQAFLTNGPLPGGTYTEGEVGQVKSLNPVLPESTAASDVSRLIFSGLTRNNSKRGIEGDLAQSWDISPDGRSYTFHLRHGVKWHDGVPFTAQDIVYTLSAIQNPDTRSPLSSSWQGITLTAQDDFTVTYNLPAPYTPFIYSTTVGILPAHLLASSDPATLRVSNFNQHPVGTGPFKLTRFVPAEQQILLTANPDYYFGKPLLDQFKFVLFDDQAAAAGAYAKRQLSAIADLRDVDERKLGTIRHDQLSLPEETTLFMRLGQPILADKAVRQAISLAIDREAIVREAAGNRGNAIDLPLLPGQLGYSAKYQAPVFDPTQAKNLLDGAGWTGKGAARTKDGKSLQLQLVTSELGSYPAVGSLLKTQLAAVGIDLKIITADTTKLQQTYIRPRNYDLLLYSINIGADPDVYAFWHSSQVSDPGLNLSQYNSAAADKGLEAARITVDNAVRAARYGNFLAAWTADLPAVVLYEPEYIYGINPSVQGVVARKLVEPADRFFGVEKWTVLTQEVRRR